MKLLSLPLPATAPLPGPPEHQAALLRARRGYGLALTGMYTRAARQFSLATEALGDAAETAALRGAVLAYAGMAARCEGRWEAAIGHLLEAADALQRVDPERAAVLGALRCEALCCSGKLDAALNAVADNPLANAALQIARGSLHEGLEIARRVERDTGDVAAKRWAKLLVAEAQLDLGRAADAEPLLDALVGELEPARAFDEVYVRALVLRARAACERLWGKGAEARPTVKEVLARIGRAEGYATNMPRYRAGCGMLRAQVALVQREDPAPALTRASAELDRVGARLDEARALARFAACAAAVNATTTGSWVARGRDLLSRSGATARLQAFTSADGAGGGSVMIGASMLGASILARPTPGGPSDDAGVELAAVFEVNRAIASVLEVDPLMQRILDEVIKVLRAERGAILEIGEGGTIRCMASRKIDPERLGVDGEGISFTVVREVERTGKVILTDNAQLDERFSGKASVLATDIRSVICAPLRTQKRVLGYLYVDSTVRSRMLGEAHRELVEVFSTQAAVALENAYAFREIEALNAGLERKVEERTSELRAANEELASTLENLRSTRLKLLEAQKEALEAEMNVARKVQQSIVPPRGQIARPGATLVGFLEPSSQVGGDFWTYLDLPGGRTLILVGDATGHGVGSGMLTTVAKACGDTLVRRLPDVQVELFLSTLSDVIYDSARGELGMTAFACVIDPATRTLHYANAGHNPPLTLEPTAAAPKLGALTGAGNRLGDGVGNTYQAISRPYLPGTRLMLYTDGLVECTNPEDEQYGDRRLRRLWQSSAKLPLQAQLDRIVGEAMTFFGTQPREDDVTVLLVELE